MEHLQPLAEDPPEGYEQVCLECHPEILSNRPMLLADESSATPLSVSAISVGRTTLRSDSSATVDFVKCPTLIGSNQDIIFSLPSYSSLGTTCFFFARVTFSNPVSFDSDSYLWYSSTTTHEFDRYSYSHSSFSDSKIFPSITYTSFQDDYFSEVVSSRISTASSSTSVLFLSFQYIGTLSPGYLGRFYVAEEQYTGTGMPPEPGWDEEDGWLGGLIKAIIEGIQKIIDGIVNLPANIAAAIKGFFDMVVNAIVQLGQTILDGLKSLFIPSDGYFGEVAADMQTWLEDHLGLLVYPFTLVADLASRVAAVQGGEPTAHIPEIAYTDDGEKYVLIEEQEVNLYDQVGRNETFIELHQLYLMAMDAAIAGALAFLAWRKFDQITGGSST